MLPGYELPIGTSLRDVYSAGRVHPKPLLAGTNTDDISIFFGTTPLELWPWIRGKPMVTPQDLALAIPRLLPHSNKSELDRISELYEPAKFADA